MFVDCSLYDMNSLLVAAAALPASSRRSPVGRRQVVSMGVPEAINAYVDIWSPTIKTIAASAEINPALIKWFHGG